MHLPNVFVTCLLLVSSHMEKARKEIFCCCASCNRELTLVSRHSLFYQTVVEISREFKRFNSRVTISHQYQRLQGKQDVFKNNGCCKNYLLFVNEVWNYSWLVDKSLRSWLSNVIVSMLCVDWMSLDEVKVDRLWQSGWQMGAWRWVGSLPGGI